jgi:Tfp pilus assembly protein PilN
MRELLGIEFREDAVVLTQLRNGFFGVKALSSASFPFKSDDETISSIMEHLSRRGIRGGRVFASIPDKWAIVKFIELPLTKERGREALSQLIKYEIERHIPFQIEDVSYDYQIVSESDSTFRAVFAAASKAKLETINEFLQKLSLRSDVVTISSFAVLSAMEMSGTSVGGWRHAAGISRRSPLFSSHGQVNAALYINDMEAVMAVMKNGSLAHMKAFFMSDSKPLQVLADEISGYIKNVSAEMTSSGFNNLLIAGAAPSMPGIEEVLKEKLGINTVRINLLDKLKGPEMTGIAASSGAVLIGLRTGSCPINMLQHKTDYESRRASSVMAKILFSLTILLVVSIFAASAFKEKRYLQGIENELKKNEPQVKAIEKLSSDINTFKIRKDFLAAIKREDVSLEVLRELSVMLPSDTWITNLDYKGAGLEGGKKTAGEVVLSGFSASSSKLISLLEDSQLFEQVVFVGPIRKVMEKEGFKLKANITAVQKSEAPEPSSKTSEKPAQEPVKGENEASN